MIYTEDWYSQLKCLSQRGTAAKGQKLFLALLDTVEKRVFDGFIQGNPLCDIIFKHPLYEIKQLLMVRATGDQVLLQETIINKKSVAIQKLFVSKCLHGLKQKQNFKWLQLTWLIKR